MKSNKIVVKIKDYEVFVPEKYADRTFYTIWAALAVWGLYALPALIAVLK